MSSYSKRVPLITELKGRNLEPWRAILSVAVFLEDMGEIGIAQRMAELAWKYNNEEKINLQGVDLTMLIIQALVECAKNAKIAKNAINKSYWFSTKEITRRAIQIAKNEELDIDPNSISSRGVGRLLRSLRFTSKRPSSSSLRGWRVTAIQLEHWCNAYTLPYPECLKHQENFGINGTDGIDGFESFNVSDTPIILDDSGIDVNSSQPCFLCGRII